MLYLFSFMFISDEAVAAFVETVGPRLRELYLNNVKQVCLDGCHGTFICKTILLTIDTPLARACRMSRKKKKSPDHFSAQH